MRFIKYVKSNIRRTPYQAIAATIVMFLTFFSLLFFTVLVIGSQRILQYYEGRPQAIAFFKDSATMNDVNAIEDALRKTGKVTSLNYVSKDEALKIYQDRNKDNPLLLELVTANILPASLEISTATPADLNEIGAMVKKEPVVDDVVIPEDAIQGLTRATTVIRWVGGATALFLGIFSFFLVLMVTGFKIRIKRNEIEIMRLLGASGWFIKAPYLLEGIFYGTVGALTAWGLSYAILLFLTPDMTSYLQGIPTSVVPLPVPPLFMSALLGGALLLGALIGSLGSYAAVRRYMRL